MSPWLMEEHRTVNYAHTQIILQLPYLFLGGIGGIFSMSKASVGQCRTESGAFFGYEVCVVMLFPLTAETSPTMNPNPTVEAIQSSSRR